MHRLDVFIAAVIVIIAQAGRQQVSTLVKFKKNYIFNESCLKHSLKRN
jgi:hypothetical protein